MARTLKRMKRVLRRAAMTGVSAAAAVTPGPVRQIIGPPLRYADMLIFDHLIIRLAFPNRHRLGQQAWRAAQPLPHQMKAIKALGVRTVVNLRGNFGTAGYREEKAAVERHGLIYVDYKLRSRAAPTREELHGFKDLFATLEHPVLFHCKSGADRAGLASVLYLHVVEGVPIEEAKRQLSLRYGHIRQADTGVLDFLFERYLEHARNEPIAFFDWVDQHYDPDALKRSFHASGMANRLIDSVLKRE